MMKVTERKPQHVTFSIEDTEPQPEGHRLALTYTTYSEEEYKRWKPFFDRLAERLEVKETR